MSCSFDLTQEPWIPCLMLDGTTDELSLTEALIRAHEIREVLDPSPLVTVSLHRLMLAILHRVFGPRDVDEWAALWERGSFDEEVIGSYLSEWRHRFDLFDEERPFYQSRLPEEKMQKLRDEGKPLTPIAKLAPELAAGNNDTLFDHSLDASPRAISAANAARWIVAKQNYDPSGTTSGLGTGPGHASMTPPYGAAVTLTLGRHLFATLLLNLVQYSPEYDLPCPCDDDKPTWEHTASATPAPRPCRGYLDYLTWQHRLILLDVGAAGGAADPVVREFYMVPGAAMPMKDPLESHETMVALFIDETANAPQSPFKAFRLKAYRAVWRDSTALLQSVPGAQRRPRNLDWVARVSEQTQSGNLQEMNAGVLGLCTEPRQPAKVHFWRHERMPVPLKYLIDEKLVADLSRALTLAEEVDAALRDAIWALASTIAAPDDDKDASQDAIRPIANGFAAREVYWSELEPRFHELLLQLAQEDGEDDGNAVLRWWAEDIAARTAMHAFDRTTDGLPATYRFLKASVRARNSLGGRIYRKVIRDYRKEVNHASTN